MLDPLQAELPTSLPLVVVMERRQIADNRWTDASWRAIGVTVDPEPSGARVLRRRLDGGNEVQHELHSGFQLQLQKDECESYYHNLLSPHPYCYVVASIGEEMLPLPRLVTLSFDEAHAYMEGGEELYTVDMPAEIYRWAEAFVLQNYLPERRNKRKRRAWTQEQTPQ